MHSLDVSDGERSGDFVLEGINDPGSSGGNTASVSAPVILIQAAPVSTTSLAGGVVETGRDDVLSQPIVFMSPPGAYQGDLENEYAGPSVIQQMAPAQYPSPIKLRSPVWYTFTPNRR